MTGINRVRGTQGGHTQGVGVLEGHQADPQVPKLSQEHFRSEGRWRHGEYQIKIYPGSTKKRQKGVRTRSNGNSGVPCGYSWSLSPSIVRLGYACPHVTLTTQDCV